MDLLLRNAVVVDGTGSPARPGDVAVVGDRIAAVRDPGELSPARGSEVVDLDGLVLAPGFIDVHTHYDAQILWDPDLTPSGWHGVTSVVMGNCGFTVAPTRPDHRDLVMRLFENVEGMARQALERGIDWSFESFPEYLAAVARRPKRLNVGAMVGHSALRLYVVGPEERAATDEELHTMRELLRDALRGGALGFSTSRQPNHQGAFGRPVPSRFATVEEVFSLAGVLGKEGRGVIEVSIGPGLWLEQFSELAVRNRVPVTWTALVARADRPGAALRTVERGARLPGEVYPQIACRPIVMQVTLMDPTPLGEIDEWKEVLAAERERREAVYRDPGWRDRARPATLKAWSHRWAKVDVQETTAHRDLVGIPLATLAGQQGTTPFDLMVDLALAEGLATRFRVVMDNDGDAEIGSLLADRRVLLGLSDAGAHASQLCDACYSTHLLGHWVRERGALPLELAVWRLAGQPHHVFRIAARGLIRDGFFADLVAFDPDSVGTAPPERVRDFPGGADRLVVRSTGIHHMWVNGVAVRRDGEDIAGAAPGRLLRHAPEE